ncbi:hypothetical protein DIRU0_E28040 [Diutina rugosa]
MEEGSQSRSDDAANGRDCSVHLRVEFAYFGSVVISNMPTMSCQTLCQERNHFRLAEPTGLTSYHWVILGTACQTKPNVEVHRTVCEVDI